MLVLETVPLLELVVLELETAPLLELVMLQLETVRHPEPVKLEQGTTLPRWALAQLNCLTLTMINFQGNTGGGQGRQGQQGQQGGRRSFAMRFARSRF